jgi:hypothetical protein
MTADEYRAELSALVKKPPLPEKIANIKTTRDFKELAKKAQRTSGKSLEYLQGIYNQLRNYYS